MVRHRRRVGFPATWRASTGGRWKINSRNAPAAWLGKHTAYKREAGAVALQIAGDSRGAPLDTDGQGLVDCGGQLGIGAVGGHSAIVARPRRRAVTQLNSATRRVMRFKAPLTREQLTSIQNRNLDSEDVRALLWEISRLRGLVLYADQLKRMVPSLPGQQGTSWRHYALCSRMSRV